MLTQAFTAVLLAGAALAQTFSIATPPSIQQCQPAALSWTGGTGPFILSAIPQGQTSAAALVTFAEGVTGNTYTWNVNLAQGTAINVRITDSTGAIAYSSGLTVQAGSSGCLSGASASSGAVTSAVPASSGAASSAPAASQTSVDATSLSSAAASRSSAAAASSGSASGMSMTASGTSRPANSATSGAANTSNAAGAKAAFNVPVLALAGAGAFVFLGGFAALA